MSWRGRSKEDREFESARRAAESLNSAMAGGSYAPKEEVSRHFTIAEASALKVGDVVEVFVGGTDLAAEWSRAELLHPPTCATGRVSLKLQTLSQDGRPLAWAFGVVMDGEHKGTVRKASVKEDKLDIPKTRYTLEPLSTNDDAKEDDSVNEVLVLRWLGVSVILDRTGWDLMKEADAVGRDHILDNIDPPPSDGLWICECFVEDAGASDWGGGARDVSIGGTWRPATKEEVESFKAEDNAWAHR